MGFLPEASSLAELGLAGLFLSAFLAGSILPFASEAVLVAVLLLGTEPWPAVTVATAGNVLGALTLYAMGRWVTARESQENALLHRLLARHTTEDPVRLEKAHRRIERWGPLALVAAWIPLLGDALVLCAGLLALPLAPVTLFVTLGKAARYATVAVTVAAVS